MDEFLAAAIEEAKQGLAEGGIHWFGINDRWQKCPGVATINGYKKAVQYYMPMDCLKMPADLAPPSTKPCISTYRPVI